MTRWTKEQLETYLLGHGSTLPSLPELPDDGPESRLQGKIVAWCKEWGRPCLSFPRTPAVRRFLPPGWPDVTIAMPGGRTVWLELKAAKGHASKEQKRVHLQLMALGHEVHVVRSFRAFLEIVSESH